MGDEYDATMAVLAHGLLTSISVVRGVFSTLQEGWEQLSPEEREYLLGRGEAQSAHIANVLADLVRSLPVETIDYLNSLTAEHVPER